MTESRAMYDYLRRCNSTDTYDVEYDDGICWAWLDEEDNDVYDQCCRAIQKRVRCVREGAPYSTVADISGFVRWYMSVLYDISQYHREPMESTDPTDNDAVYHGVRLVNAMMQGYATDDEYEKLLSVFKEEIANEMRALGYMKSGHGDVIE